MQNIDQAIKGSQALAEKWLCRNSISPKHLTPFIGTGAGYLKAGQHLLAGLHGNPSIHNDKQRFINQVNQIDFLRSCVNDFRYWAVDHIAENLHYGNTIHNAKNDAINCAEFINCAIELAYLLHDNNIFVISQTIAGED